MRRALLRISVPVLVLLGLMFTTLVSWAPSETSDVPELSRIVDYRASLRVDDTGTLHAVEDITVVFPDEGRHGIFRFWDVVDPEDPGVRLVPRDIEVWLDGGEQPFEMVRDEEPRYRVARVGDPEWLLYGRHTYRISYRIDGVLAAAEDATGSLFWWDVVARGWRMPIAQATVTVELPGDVQDADCDDCTVARDGSTLTLTGGPLAPNTPMTLRSTTGTAAPERTSLPWSVRWDMLLGRSLPVVVVLLPLTPLGLALGLLLARRAHEPDPGYPVVLEPPAGLGPVQTAFIVEERVPRDALAATLLHQAERGLVRIDHAEGDGEVWTVTGLRAALDWNAVDRVSEAVGRALGVTEPGSVFVVRPRSTTTGAALTRAKKAGESAVRTWADRQGLLRPTPGGMLLQAGAVVALVAGAALMLVPLWPSLTGLPVLAVGLGGLSLLRPGARTRRTAEGRDVWSRAGGFRRLLSTPSAEDRFDFSARRDLYTAYIPYAVAFGSADAWAEKYATSVGEPPPTPAWLPVTATSGWDGGRSGLRAGLAGFESSLSSSISAYQASQRSSSSGGRGGGGGGGGGAGGGGGGGSW